MKKNFKVIKIIFFILYLFSTTSCSLKNLKQKNDFLFNEIKSNLKILVIPKNIKIPTKNENYSVPYRDKDLEKEDCDIFPPI